MAKKFKYDSESDTFTYTDLADLDEDHKKVKRATKNEEIFRAYLNNIIEDTREKGERLTNKELKRITGSDHWSGRDDYFDSLYYAYLDAHPEILSDTSSFQAEQNAAAAGVSIEALQQVFAGMQPSPITQQLNAQGLNTDYQAYLDALNTASDIQYQTAMDELAMAENQMYRSIGLSQRQMERDIAKRRQQALKSGMSTAQLAAQEQQNILAAQTGAAQIAQQYADQRYSTINQFAGTQAQNYANTLAQQTQYNQNLQQFNAQQSANWASALAQVFPQYYAADQYKEQNK